MFGCTMIDKLVPGLPPESKTINTNHAVLRCITKRCLSLAVLDSASWKEMVKAIKEAPLDYRTLRSDYVSGNILPEAVADFCCYVKSKVGFSFAAAITADSYREFRGISYLAVT
jgi:hypothetical protein